MPTVLQELTISGRHLKGGDRVIDIVHPIEGMKVGLYYRRTEEVDGNSYALFDVPAEYHELVVQRYVDIPWHDRDPEWKSYGKFSCEIDERVYEEFGMDPNDSCGESDTTGWFGLCKWDEGAWLSIKGDQFWEVNHVVDVITKNLSFPPIGAIVCVNSQGFVSVDYFHDEGVLDSKWEEISNDVSEKMGDDEDDF